MVAATVTREAGPLAVADLAGAYRSHRAELLRVACRMVGVVEAESVIQEVFVELLRNAELRQRFTGGSLGAWLKEITRRKGFEYLRRHGREIATGDGDGGPAGAGAANAVYTEPHLVARQMVERFLGAHVPQPQRQFFVLRFLEHRTQVEAATALGLPRSTLEGWEHRLSDALRRFILEAE